MRAADIRAAWAGCRRLPLAHLSLGEIAAEGVSETVLRVVSLVTALIGNNGTGKTGLLASMNLTAEHALPPHIRPHRIRLSGQFRGTTFMLGSDDNAEARKPLATFIDAGARCHTIKDYFRSQDGLEDAVGQAGLTVATQDQLDRYRYVCGRNYSSLSVAELELPRPATSIVQADDDEAELTLFF